MRFLHTSDWQLGMTRHFLDEGAQERFTQARYDSIAAMAAEASTRECEFVVVAGDVFDTNQVDRRTVSRAVAVLEQFTMPVYLLPGNHDCLDPGSVYRQRAFIDRCPEHVRVLGDGEPQEPVPGVEVVGAPWTSKRPLEDLASAACAGDIDSDRLRVVVAHGAVDDVIGGVSADPSLIRRASVEAALESGRLHYLALGDRHSCTEVGSTGRMWYSGAPEPTSYAEVDPGTALIIDLEPGSIEVQRLDVGTWRFARVERDIDSDADIDALDSDLRGFEDRARTIAKIAVRGALTLNQLDRLERMLDEHADVFAALERPERHRDIVVRPSEDDFGDLELHGYAGVACDRLQGRVRAESADSATAADALGLLLRLVGDDR